MNVLDFDLRTQPLVKLDDQSSIYFLHNALLDTDSYKLSHPQMYPPGTTGMFHYLEARKGGAFPFVRFFGLTPILQHMHWGMGIEPEGAAVSALLAEAHGVPFPDVSLLVNPSWPENHAVPLRIRAIPEGLVVPEGTPLLTVESLEPSLFWLGGLIETQLMRVWYPTAVATLSYHVVQHIIRPALEHTCGPELAAALLPSRLHDFGSRGTTSRSAAELGGMAHLINSQGTDTVVALTAAREYYGAAGAPGFSLPAMEHSTVTSWGKDGEVDAYRNALKVYGGPGKLLSIVVDSYDAENAVRNIIGGALKDEIIASGTTVVVRPDSGEPVSMVLSVLDWLDATYGSTLNDRGFKVLHPSVRVIQGDGLNAHVIEVILDRMIEENWSVENIVFGMGGQLLQAVTRDTQRVAYKASAIQVDGEWRGVQKMPKTDPSKASKAGRLDVIWNGSAYETVVLEDGQVSHPDSVMVTVYEGQPVNTPTWAEVLARGERR